jgi:hypothetical protein
VYPKVNRMSSRNRAGIIRSRRRDWVEALAYGAGGKADGMEIPYKNRLMNLNPDLPASRIQQ